MADLTSDLTARNDILSWSLSFDSTSSRTRTGSCSPALAKSTSNLGSVAEKSKVCLRGEEEEGEGKEGGKGGREGKVREREAARQMFLTVTPGVCAKSPAAAQRTPTQRVGRPRQTRHTQHTITLTPSPPVDAADDPVWQ